MLFSFTPLVIPLILSTFTGSIEQDSLPDRVLYQSSVRIFKMFEKFEFGYSMKNVSLPSQKEYLISLISSVETFVKNLRWRCFFFLNPQDEPSKENYEFKSLRQAPKIKDLYKLENALYDMVKM